MILWFWLLLFCFSEGLFAVLLSRSLFTRGWYGGKAPAGDYAKAVADKTHAIDLQPNNAAYYDTRALSYWFMDENRSAMADATRALELAPGNTAYTELIAKIRKES